MIIGCVVGGIAALVGAYHGVSETAEQIHSKKNLEKNRELESSSNGMWSGYYIYKQAETNNSGRNAGNYAFGYASFANVGCEVASVYNLLISLNRSENLSDVIYDFEDMSIELAAGWGHLGSDPEKIYKILDDRGISYSDYSSFDSLNTKVSGLTNCKIIMSRWNSDESTGLHTFFIEKKGNNFYGYNFKSNERYNPTYKYSLKDFNDGSGFIIGYVI